MIILGIYEGHNANAALIENGRVIRAVEEERFSRIKNHDGRSHKGPINAILYCIEEVQNIDLIAIALEEPRQLSFNSYKSFLSDLDNKSRSKRGLFLVKNNKRVVDRNKHITSILLPAYPGISQQVRIENIMSILIELGLEEVPIKLVNHHLAHNSSAYFTSGKFKGLCLSMDGKGDDISAMVCIANNGKIKELSRINYIESIGHFYSAITVALGFKAVRHEGKITGLAAYGKTPKSLLTQFRLLFNFTSNGGYLIACFSASNSNKQNQNWNQHLHCSRESYPTILIQRSSENKSWRQLCNLCRDM